MGTLKAIADLKCKLDYKRYTGFAYSFGGRLRSMNWKLCKQARIYLNFWNFFL